MKRIFITIVALAVALTVSAEQIVRSGLYFENGNPVISNPVNSVAVSVTVQTDTFTPGEFARYAQKLLGVRASLAEHKQTKIVSASLYDAEPKGALVHSENSTAESVVLPDFRMDNRAMTVEQQAAAAADMLFSLRRHRKELITGEAGENVFGAGLAAALEKIAAIEKQILDMFYGTTTTAIQEYRYTITPTAEQTSYTVCRYREDEGVVDKADLSGTPVMVVITPAQVDTEGLPFATEKDKVKRSFTIAAQCKVELFVGTQTMDSLSIPMFQYGKTVVLAIK